MTKADYTALDAAILERIGRGDVPAFSVICAFPAVNRITTELERASHPHPACRRFDWRFTDGRLKALKRAGKIRYTGKGWVLA